MSRQVRRVPMDFDWPLNDIWPGFLLPDGLGDDDVESWEPTDPPEGDGWQMWEDVSEGSPISPVFDAPEPLAHWLADNETYPKATYDQWLATIRAGWAPSFIFSTATGLISGVEASGGAS